MYIDTHCHLYNSYYNNIEEIIEKAKLNGVSKIIVNGCDLKSNKEVLGLVKKYDIVYGALGFQPTEIDNDTINQLNWLEKHIQDEKIVAVGEIGLDYHYNDYDKNLQLDIFKRQLNIAQKYKKPVIVHSRDSIQDAYNILSSYNIKGTIHCFSGSLEMAEEFTKLGYYLGIGGVITFKNAKNIIKVVEKIDLNKLLLETDAPYLTPEPFRKEKNDSSYLYVIAKKIAEVKAIDLEEVSTVTTQSACDLFDF